MASLASQWPHAFMRTAESITLHYVDVGPRDALPVVLVHGWPDLWFGWRHQIQALQSSYRLIVPDLRGFGQSSTPQHVEAYGAKNVTNDLAALLDGLNIEKAVLLGHDWGGGMVWRMCLYHPERVIAVGAVCTAYTPPAKCLMPLDVVVAKVPYFSYQKILADAENTGKMWILPPRRSLLAGFRKHSEDESDAGRRQDADYRYASRRDELQRSRSSLSDQYKHSKFQSTCQYYATREIDFKDELGMSPIINHPALFIAAANDHVLKPELASKMHRFLPNLETHVVNDAGHWVLWEQKKRVNAILKAWLDKLPASGDTRSKL
ncbi:epoxide hydrolase, putative [Phytophthora infestans T30-4]|uniref:Epoxide hydrolase, putative n=1 Tax=Phytophthora infestans (strain T30-4) TaxID=403677 RepID=D0NHJ2_PHYIT|nr:epoxide hydrolase, putative [Phytophthora infestans T30-4]EEY58917.1 epoxide hydrolase, putative [Phytophthora infestans T30-4]|eukprot:XP_002901390.1 epoxide hydrolase, putative [Phytophthora infestans T30-4]